MRRYDRYILLTSAMGKIINAKLRPQCIIEGVCDTSAQNIFEIKMELRYACTQDHCRLSME